MGHYINPVIVSADGFNEIIIVDLVVLRLAIIRLLKGGDEGIIASQAIHE